MPLQKTIKTPRRLTICLVAVIAFVAVYFLPLAIVFLDEIVLRTNYIAETLPEWVKAIFMSAYPFLGR
jgi:hypothetical protein